MLDQNTDRMWFVIGAVIVGAAIIFIANGTLPTLFASVSDSFGESAVKGTEVVSKMYPGGHIPIKTVDEYRVLQSEMNSTDNILKDSYFSAPKVTSNYLAHEFKLSEVPKVGDIYTIAIKGLNPYVLRPHNSGPAPSLHNNGQFPQHVGGDIYVGSFPWLERSPNELYKDNDDAIWLYNGVSYADSATEPFTLQWATLVKGDVPLLLD